MFWSIEFLLGEWFDEIMIVVYVYWDWYFWCYRNVWYYNMVFFEVGYMLGFIRILVDEIGFNVWVMLVFGFYLCDFWWLLFLFICFVDFEFWY